MTRRLALLYKRPVTRPILLFRPESFPSFLPFPTLPFPPSPRLPLDVRPVPRRPMTRPDTVSSVGRTGMGVSKRGHRPYRGPVSVPKRDEIMFIRTLVWYS